jgi:hypothetical protein
MNYPDHADIIDNKVSYWNFSHQQFLVHSFVSVFISPSFSTICANSTLNQNGKTNCYIEVQGQLIC